MSEPSSSPSPLVRRLRRRIRRDGPIPFAAFMEEALYGDGGYYAGDELPIGETGDFVTGSTFSRLFARTTHRLLGRLDTALGLPAELLEAGYGDGRHLVGVASCAAAESRRIRGVDRVERPLSDLPPSASLETARGLEAIASEEVAGLIFAYELFDALPVHRLVGRDDGTVGELWVGLDEAGEFAWQLGELSDRSLANLLGEPPEALSTGQIADLAPAAGPLYAELAGRLDRGLLVVCDYGFERSALLDMRVRMHGTLACYHRQRVHRNPFVRVGGQDLTAHVDFTTLRRAGEAAGLETVALTRQARWLIACGLFDELQGSDDATRREAMKLLDGEGMGEDLRVLVQARGVDPEQLFDLDILR